MDSLPRSMPVNVVAYINVHMILLKFHSILSRGRSALSTPGLIHKFRNLVTPKLVI